MATGLLIVCIGKGTKSIESFVGMQKEYSGTLRLGQSTDSYDADGKIVSESQEWEHVTGKYFFIVI
jgi:tRNA pseudouridine55 synthase